MPTALPSRDDMTADEAADELRVTPATVRTYCRAGRLPGVYRVGGQWRVPRLALAFAAERPVGIPSAIALPHAQAMASLRAQGLL